MEIESFVGPCEIARADRRVQFGLLAPKSIQLGFEIINIFEASPHLIHYQPNLNIMII
jgi:hypothetical protein